MQYLLYCPIGQANRVLSAFQCALNTSNGGLSVAQDILFDDRQYAICDFAVRTHGKRRRYFVRFSEYLQSAIDTLRARPEEGRNFSLMSKYAIIKHDLFFNCFQTKFGRQRFRERKVL